MISSTKNTKIVEARKLNQRKHRLRQNRFLVDGLQLLGMAAQNERVQPIDLFYCEALFTGNAAPQMLEALTQAGGQPIPVTKQVMATLSERDTPQGVVATVRLDSVECSPAALLNLERLQAPQDSQLILILDRLQDPGNLGTLLRTADGVGAAAVILIEPCVDPFDLKTVRGSMGSLFNIPFARTADVAELFNQLTEWGYRLVGADGQRGELVWRTTLLEGTVGLILGNEARGVSSDLHVYLTDYVSLPLLGGAESLNVAVAGGTLMYDWLRVNSIE